MEPLNPLEKLNILEKKITSVVELLRAEKELSAKLAEERNLLAEEKIGLLARLEAVESSLLKGSQNIELTKMVVDELIKNIDQLVGQEQQ